MYESRSNKQYLLRNIPRFFFLFFLTRTIRSAASVTNNFFTLGSFLTADFDFRWNFTAPDFFYSYSIALSPILGNLLCLFTNYQAHFHPFVLRNLISTLRGQTFTVYAYPDESGCVMMQSEWPISLMHFIFWKWDLNNLEDTSEDINYYKINIVGTGVFDFLN